MPRKQFAVDLKVAQQQNIDNVSNVKRGESEGEVSFTYAHQNLPAPIQIQVLGEQDDYPDSSQFMAFTDDQDVSPEVLAVLGSIGAWTFGKTVSEVLTFVSRKLSAALSSEAHSDMEDDGDTVMTDESDFYEGDGVADYLDDDDSEVYFGPSNAGSPTAVSTGVASAKLTRQSKRDLRSVRDAGYHLGLFQTQNGELANVFSMSYQVNRLGLPEETLEAWDLKAWEYVVLLCRHDGPLPTVEEYVADPKKAQFLLGKCPKYKPSYASARSAFKAPKMVLGQTQGTLDSDVKAAEEDPSAFSLLYVSNSLQRFMSAEFANILAIRLNPRTTWDDAKQIYRNARNASAEATDTPNIDSLWDPAGASSENLAIRLDHAPLDKSAALPRTAMDFAILHLITSTTMCMVCHKKVDHAFEAVKPYVCEKPLCEFQYMELGFGPSVEHDIINQPYVVDLLISFCYAALQQNQSRGILRSLRIKVPNTSFRRLREEMVRAEARTVAPAAGLTTTSPASPAPGEPEPTVARTTENHGVMIKDGIITFIYTAGQPQLRPGDLFALVIPPYNIKLHQSREEVAHCRVREVDIREIKFDLVARHPLNSYVAVLPDPEVDGEEAKVPQEQPLKGRADFFLYDQYLCDLEPTDQMEAMLSIVQTIPAVSEMRRFLRTHPGERLSSWPSITKPALELLTWIVASNRSHIVQLDQPIDGEDGSMGIVVKPEEKIQGLPDGWMQFRFAQGSPMKEERFYQELRRQSFANPQFPTIFAWHGSPVRNWHNIIREGLTFDHHNVAHGRSFGHGVYFAREWATSATYSGISRTSFSSNTRTPGVWQNSKLQVTSALSLCEIVNQPSMFVTRSPYYVVAQVDWIQCRYLIVQVNSNQEPTLPDPDAPSPPQAPRVSYIEQDPACQTIGPDNKPVLIPASALPKVRREAQVSNLALQEPMMGTPAEEAVEVDLEDAVLLLSDDEEEATSSTPCIEPATEDLPATSSYQLDASKSDFRPGTLDLASLPGLSSPTWATNQGLRKMGREIKEMQKVQASTPLHELGWFLDFDKVSNLFHWFVELHSFDPNLPLAKDMKTFGFGSIVLEMRFGREFPMTPPFVRVVRPRFLTFLQGGGGHVTAGGAMCMELLTNSGWSPANSIESVLLQIRMALSSTDPRPARLVPSGGDYGIGEAIDAYRRAAISHGWAIPPDLHITAAATWEQSQDATVTEA